MTQKHTPGPWEASGPLIYVGNGRNRRIVADAGTYHGRDPEKIASTIANARLISAAPDLLAALRAVTWHLDARLIATPDDHAQEAISLSAAALRKATGE